MSAASPMPIQERSQIHWVSDHARQRFCERTGDWRNLLAVWYEAEPVDYPSAQGHSYARYHPGYDLVLIAAWGELMTCVELTDRPLWERRDVRDQIQERDFYEH